MQQEIRQEFSVRYAFPVLFTRGAFDPANPTLRDVLRRAGEKKQRVLVAIDSNVPAMLRAYSAAHPSLLEWAAEPFLVRGGEICKTDPVEVAQLQELVARHRIDRQSFILAIGGGAMLDAVGYAAATAHRGVRLIRMPTTVLGQNDAGIGVKNSVNAFGRKNFLGTFAPPFAVINDAAFLGTLDARDLRSGMAEAVKIAAIKDAPFLAWMHRERRALGAFAPAAMDEMILRCAQRHIEHVGSSDPFETGSARPLDFGHWAAHCLEEMTSREMAGALPGSELRHGEAVAIGCALDSLYAHAKKLITDAELAVLLDTLEAMGFALYDPALARMNIEEALASFREHLGGEMCITVPDGLGKKRELHDIDLALMRRCIEQLGARANPTGRASATG